MAYKTEKEIISSNGIRIKGNVSAFENYEKEIKIESAHKALDQLYVRSQKLLDEVSKIAKKNKKEKRKRIKIQPKAAHKSKKRIETEAELKRKADAQKRIEMYHQEMAGPKSTTHSSFNVVQKREWILDWNCVMFKKGHIVIYARQELGFKFYPTEVSVSKSIESFNYLKKYLNERLSPVRCEIVGLKLRIIDRINFDDAIQQFAMAARQGIIRTGGSRTKVVSSPQPMSFSQALSKAKQMTEDEFRKYKSKYIDFLVMEQSKQHKVIPCVERLAHENSDNTEYAFMFSLKCNSGKILIVHENVNPNRSTLLFVVKGEKYDKAIRAIYDFLQSAEINKRSSLRSKDLDLEDNIVSSYKSINHDDVYTWKQTLSTYKKYR